MSAGTAAGSGTGTTGREKSPAQWYCIIVGLTLVAAGLLGFITESSFGVSDDLERGALLGLDVNGWHNIVHLLSGLFLLSGARDGAPSRSVALTFGVIYAVVSVIGLIDGDDILGILPINAADNVLHLALSALAFVAAFMTRDHAAGRTRTA